MFAKCDALPKGDVLDMFVEGIHAFCKFQASTPYQKLELPESPSTFRHLCIKSWLHHAHPFVVTAEKICLIQSSRGFGHGVVVFQELLQLTDCVFM